MRRLAGTRGSAMVELALGLPVLLLLVLGILDLGRAFNAYVTVRSAGAEGAHWAALHPSAAPEDIATAIRSRVVPLDPTLVGVTVAYHDGVAWAAWPEDGIPSSQPARRVSISVDVSYPWAAVTVLAHFVPSGGAAFASRAVAEALR